MPSTGTFDCTAIMHHAWALVRKGNRAKFGLRILLRNAMRAAWSEAKHQAAMARRALHLQAETPEARRTRAAIDALESKDRLTQPDYARLGVLRAALRAAQVHGLPA
jgi:hypothetical protein